MYQIPVISTDWQSSTDTRISVYTKLQCPDACVTTQRIVPWIRDTVLTCHAMCLTQYALLLYAVSEALSHAKSPQTRGRHV